MGAQDTGRQATIDQALTLLDTADGDTLAAALDSTNLRAGYRQDPQGLREKLAAGSSYGNYKAAQQLLRGAGKL